MGLVKRNKVWWMNFMFHGKQVRRSNLSGRQSTSRFREAHSPAPVLARAHTNHAAYDGHTNRLARPELSRVE